MKNKKLLWLLIGLVSVCVLLAACGSEKNPTEPSETVTEAPVETQPLETEPPVETAPAATEPTEPVETTEPEETQPEETQPSGGATQPNVNTGTGGGYNPGETTDPTEPAEPTQPVIEVPTPGSENNAYYEQIKDGSGEFSTVKISAGGAVHYRIKTAGSFLRIEDAEISVVYNGETYVPQDGVIALDLPADDAAPLALQFANQGAEVKQFKITVQDAVGSQTNPVVLDSLEQVSVSLEEGDLDGTYYSWTADKTGELRLTLTGDVSADVNVSVNGKAAQLTEDADGNKSLNVKQNDQLLIQVQAQSDGEGNVSAADLLLQGYIIPIVELKISQIPTEAETIAIPAGRSVYYKIIGAKNKQLQLTAENVLLSYNDSSVSPDENGKLRVNLVDSPALIEICNTGSEEKTFQFTVGYPAGHLLNPHILTALGELPTVTQATENGYYYSYTAANAGVLTFQMWTYPELENVKIDITMTNKTSGEAVSLWTTDENGEPLENATISLNVAEGDELTIYVTAKNVAGRNVDAEFAIYGELYGSEELPIFVEYPGFKASVPAGKTLYYAGYNMSGMILSVEGENLTIGHNGTTHNPVDGKISFTVVAEGRNPALFAITNSGAEDAAYEVTFAYPAGHSENPDQLKLGVNTVTRNAGAADYYYTFTAPKDGRLVLSFDPSAQWVYAVDNVTQGVYGDTQWSDSDPLMAETTLTLKSKDVIRIRVNTYDAANMFESPAGTVTFEARFVTGPTHITGFNLPTYATMAAGEHSEFTGKFYGYILKITGDANTSVEFNGLTYRVDSTGSIRLEMPKSGTEDLSIMVHNGSQKQLSVSLLFSTQNTGSAENPEKLTVGNHSMVQDTVGGADYYYQFISERNGRLVITFETDVDAIIVYNGNQVLYTHTGRNKITITVRAGAKVNLSVNTYDQANPMVSPIGTVDFTVELQ